VIVNVPLVVSICAGFSTLAFLSNLFVWLGSRRAIRNARTRCDEGLRQLRQDLELKDRGLFTELSHLIATEREEREEDHRIAMEFGGELENFFALNQASVVSEIDALKTGLRRQDPRGRFITKKNETSNRGSERVRRKRRSGGMI
jgi:hypothetical protein